MNILKKNNGIALIAVMAIMLILTLLIPGMFDMADRSVKSAIGGMDYQRASYLARSVTEMTVAAFKQSYNEFLEDIPISTDGSKYSVYNAYKKLGIIEGVVDAGAIGIASIDDTIQSKTVYMYIKDDNAKEFKYESYDSDEAAKAATPTGYTYVGKGSCYFTFDDKVLYYKINNETQEIEEIDEATYTREAEIIENLLKSEKDAKAEFSVSQVHNRNVKFYSQATVRGKQAVRSCVVVLPTYPSEEGWLYFNGEAKDAGGDKKADTDENGLDIIESGCNQVQFKPEKRTGMTAVDYSEVGISSYEAQVLQIYSCLGNMIVANKYIKDTNEVAVKNGRDGSEFTLGVNPQLNTTPNDDPTYNILDGINAASYGKGVQKDNFISLTASNAIRVDVPVNLLVNPSRANRLGDGFDKNKSIYKLMTFQAPTICFSRRVDMMISLYNNTAKDGSELEGDARRMSSVILAAPANTPYSYPNKDRGNQNVKAGKVFFAEDCYLWVINYGDNGSGLSEHWYEVSQTVYYRDSDFTKVKIASAGDVCYFNTEIDLDGKKIGLPLSAWAIETIYYENYDSLVTNATPWWKLWTRAKQAMFGRYVKNNSKLFSLIGLETTRIFVPDDLYKIGNIYESTAIQVPQIDDFYTIWSN